MATYRTKIGWWNNYHCNTSNLMSLRVNGRYPVRVQTEIVPAVKALEHALVTNGYESPMGPTGSYLCRNIAGTSLPSLHSFGIAIDWDYPNNPHLRRALTRGAGSWPGVELQEHQIDAVEAITNAAGDQIWKWLGWSIGDTMHFEIDVPPGHTQPAMEDLMPTQQWHQMIDALFIGRPDKFHGDPDYWKTLDPDSSEWTDFFAAFVNAISLT